VVGHRSTFPPCRFMAMLLQQRSLPQGNLPRKRCCGTRQAHRTPQRRALQRSFRAALSVLWRSAEECLDMSVSCDACARRSAAQYVRTDVAQSPQAASTGSRPGTPGVIRLRPYDAHGRSRELLPRVTPPRPGWVPGHRPAPPTPGSSVAAPSPKASPPHAHTSGKADPRDRRASATVTADTVLPRALRCARNELRTKLWHTALALAVWIATGEH
jgi:hypothetical protein